MLFVLPFVGSMHKTSDHMYSVLDSLGSRFVVCLVLRCYSPVSTGVLPSISNGSSVQFKKKIVFFL